MCKVCTVTQTFNERLLLQLVFIVQISKPWWSEIVPDLVTKVNGLPSKGYFLVKVVSLTITQQSVDCSDGIPLILMSGSAAVHCPAL